MTWFFLSSGLFLGWSLGANDAANVFGTAVGTRMIRFKMAAIIASSFVVLGAVVGGAGPAQTYGRLGAVNAIAGSFTVALSAGLTLSWMTKLGLPVSTTQAIVGAIIGWDLFSGWLVDTRVLNKILATWLISPALTGILSLLLYKLTRFFLSRVRIHILEADFYTRAGLILVGCFASYSLGANNIANVMGVFVNSNPFREVNLFGIYTLTGTQVLFLVGGILIGVGIFTHSHRVMKTIGSDLLKLSPTAALIVVLAESIVLFIFASQGLERFLIRLGLPTIPLVPVSSSQAVVGGIIGIALVRGGARTINLSLLGRIFWGWILTPIVAGVLTFFSLFFMQNVFQQNVFHPAGYSISKDVLFKLEEMGIRDERLEGLEGAFFEGARNLRSILKEKTQLNRGEIHKVIQFAEIDSALVDSTALREVLGPSSFTPAQWKAIKRLHGSLFVHRWQLVDSLSQLTTEWKFKEETRKNQRYNRELKRSYERLFRALEIQGSGR